MPRFPGTRLMGSRSGHCNAARPASCRRNIPPSPCRARKRRNADVGTSAHFQGSAACAGVRPATRHVGHAEFGLDRPDPEGPALAINADSTRLPLPCRLFRRAPAEDLECRWAACTGIRAGLRLVSEHGDGGVLGMGRSSALSGLSLSACKGKPAGHWYACRRGCGTEAPENLGLPMGWRNMERPRKSKG